VFHVVLIDVLICGFAGLLFLLEDAAGKYFFAVICHPRFCARNFVHK